MKYISAIAVIAVIIFGCLTGWAQTYKSNVLYDVKWPVASVKYDKENPINKLVGAVKFSEDGRPKKDIMTYDTEGYPIGYGMKYGKTCSASYITYDDEHRPVKITAWGNTDAKEPVTTTVIDITYSPEGVEAVTMSYKETGKVLEFIYSGRVLDNHGNWIRRKVKEVKRQGAEVVSTEEYEETRMIEYPKNS